MPRTVISAGATATIGGQEPTPQVEGPRKSLVMVMVSGADAYWRFTRTPDGTVTAAGATDAGIPMALNERWTFDAETLRMNNTIRVFSSGGCTINYTELKHL